MAKIRLRALPLSLLAFIGVAASVLAASSPSPMESAPGSSPSSPSLSDEEIELICHTDNPSECYPKLFQPTHEFQPVRPDQDLPKGLHVRLNVQTGEKEAKINNPDEVNPALEGLPVDSSMVIVDAPPEQDPPPPQIPPNAPTYEPAGKIKEPPNNTDESSAFYRSLTILKKNLAIDDALTMLEEISHDIYYGLKIAEDLDTVRQLFCLSTSPSTTPSRARLAALTLASTLQNNPKALASITSHWPTIESHTCPGASEPLGTATFRLLPPSSTPDPLLTKARISLLSHLLPSPLIRKHFLSRNGMSYLLEVLALSQEPEWEPAQKQAGYLVMDNFLDGDMGAAVGEWPTEKQAADGECARREKEGVEGGVKGDCWDWHAEGVAKGFKEKEGGGHWTGELVKKVKEERGRNLRNGKKGRKGREEL